MMILRATILQHRFPSTVHGLKCLVGRIRRPNQNNMLKLILDGSVECIIRAKTAGKDDVGDSLKFFSLFARFVVYVARFC